jgi:hypothetical protein
VPGIHLASLDRSDRLENHLGVDQEEVDLGTDEMSQQVARVLWIVPAHVGKAIRGDGKVWQHHQPLHEIVQVTRSPGCTMFCTLIYQRMATSTKWRRKSMVGS